MSMDTTPFRAIIQRVRCPKRKGHRVVLAIDAHAVCREASGVRWRSGPFMASVSLTVCPETLCGITKLSKHGANGCETQEGPRLAVQAFPVLCQPSTAVGRVGDWRAGLGRCLCSPLARPFVCECHNISTMPRFQPPPHRTQRANFWHYAHLFASPQSLWDLSCRDSFPRGSTHPIVIE